MNKKILLTAASIFVMTAAILTSCFIVNTEEDNSLPAPSVLKGTSSSKQYSISIPYIKGMEYANVLRQKSTTTSFKDYTTENIGQVKLNSDVKDSTVPSFAFEDNYTTSGVYYRYAIRYKIGTSYTTTKYSDGKEAEGLNTTEAEITVTSGSETKLSVAYTRNDSTESYKLDVTPGVTLPSDDFTTLAVIISNGKISRPFAFPCTISSTTVDESDMSIPNLRGTLPDDFFDVELKVKGVIAYTQTTDASKTYTRYYWSSVIETDTPSISYTDASGDIQTTTKIIVPSRESAINDLDATLSISPKSISLPLDLE